MFKIYSNTKFDTFIGPFVLAAEELINRKYNRNVYFFTQNLTWIFVLPKVNYRKVKLYTITKILFPSFWPIYWMHEFLL